MFSSQTRGLLAGITLPLLSAGCATNNSSDPATSSEAVVVPTHYADRQNDSSLQSELGSAPTLALPPVQCQTLFENQPIKHQLGPITQSIGTMSLHLFNTKGTDFLIAYVNCPPAGLGDVSIVIPAIRHEDAKGLLLTLEGDNTTADFRFKPGLPIELSSKNTKKDGDFLQISIGNGAEREEMNITITKVDGLVIWNRSGQRVVPEWKAAEGKLEGLK